jgi:hypothetical protein
MRRLSRNSELYCEAHLTSTPWGAAAQPAELPPWVTRPAKSFAAHGRNKPGMSMKTNEHTLECGSAACGAAALVERAPSQVILSGWQEQTGNVYENKRTQVRKRT